MPFILSNLPENYNTYYELFLGSGALFFAIEPSKAVLSDMNSDLMDTYRGIKLHPEEVIKELTKMRNSEVDYYRIRKTKPTKPSRKAARFIYLNRLCFNGIYRVNKKGEFNVPYCKDEKRRVLFAEDILHASDQLEDVELLNGDFEKAFENIKKGDFVYLDPPYAVQRKNNGFLKYNKRIFHWEEQVRLAEFARRLHEKGVYVLISNANAEEIIELYKGFEKIEAYRNCSIGGAKASRKRVTEILLKNY